jgi:hypothetical protein
MHHHHHRRNGFLAAGVDVPPIGEYHFAIVDVRGDSVTVMAQNLHGKVLDHFSIVQTDAR